MNHRRRSYNGFSARKKASLTTGFKMTEQGNVKRSWFVFSIRTLLILVVLVAIPSLYVARQLKQPIEPTLFWNQATGENVKWTTNLGSQTYSNPAVNDDYVFVGSNNAAAFDPRHQGADLGVMFCLDKRTGQVLWQYVAKKLSVGRSSDWPLQGITSGPYASDDRVWFVDNRGQVVCLDDDGFLDGVNDGLDQSETQTRLVDADVIWKFDMRAELGVFPHNMSHCNVEVDSRFVYVKTSNGVGPSHNELPAPNAPSFVVLNKNDGSLVWSSDAATAGIMHGGWGSAKLATIQGRRQILFPGGDGWLYSFRPEGDGSGKAELFWKFDCNPKQAVFKVYGKGQRDNLLVEPTVVGDQILISMGQDPEHGSAPSRIWCIRPGLKTGDLSPTLVVKAEGSKPPSFDNGFQHCIPSDGDKEVPNSQSAKAWEYGGRDFDNDGVVEPFGRSLSVVHVVNGCAFCADINGFLHCIDLETGKGNWRYDLQANVWGGTLLVEEWLFVGTEDGEMHVFQATSDPPTKPLATMTPPNYPSYYAAPAFRDGTLYIVDRQSISAIEDSAAKNQIQKWLLE